jgi:hypothetical protein
VDPLRLIHLTKLPCDDVGPCAVNDGREFANFLRRNAKLFRGLAEIVEECIPFVLRDFEVNVGVLHVAAGVLLWLARGPTHHLDDQILESGRWNFVMSVIDQRIFVQARIRHDPIDKIIDYRSYGVYAAEPVV